MRGGLKRKRTSHGRNLPYGDKIRKTTTKPLLHNAKQKERGERIPLPHPSFTREIAHRKESKALRILILIAKFPPIVFLLSKLIALEAILTQSKMVLL